MHIHALINPTGTDFVRDDKGAVVYVEQPHAPDKDPRGYWAEAVRTDSSFPVPFDARNHVRAAEPTFELRGGRAYATFQISPR